MVSNGSSASDKCVVCGVESKSKCSNCGQAYYCSVEHQKQDWKNHKLQCHPFKIEHNEKFGRYLVASRNIKASEVVLRESCLVCGPNQISGPVCVGCMKGLQANDYLECERCGWPVCQRICQNSPEHRGECELTVARGSKIKIHHFVAPHPQYQCLSILRCMLLREKDPSKFQRLMQLESHDNQRKGSEQWISDREGIAKFIPRFFKMDNWTEDEIMQLTGILQINGHEVPLSEPPYVAIYDLASLVEHSCFPNLSKSFTKKGDVIFWAAVDIKKGTNLSICYSDALWGTASRQNHLLETKLFKCECVRCKDVTELGTKYSAIKCNRNDCPGLALPLSLEQWSGDWRCDTCQHALDKSYISDILDRAGTDLSVMKKNSTEDCFKYLQHYSKWLPPQHHHLAEVKVVLAQLIGAGGPEVIQTLDDASLDKKISFCRETLNLYEKLAPAEARVLGLLHFEMHAALAERGRRASPGNPDMCQSALEESLKHAEEVVKLLQHEPKILSEGQICAQAKINRDSLKLVLGL
ncbi:unnamed protein product [Hermetia illucens]|uniref:Protein msta n=1 Tax=Hermetia illucens TaxID=343691 RepID=A0A7R8YWX6_HERIL|nr:SET domain-containing protein SmydA-8 [Hermetia illucens]CAD7088383.1 unnamed protein product [Hermetia illucens]